MTAPFEPHGATLTAFIVVSLVAAAWGVAAMSRLGKEMKATGGPGIVPFEVAGTGARARSIIDRWGVEGRRAARRHVTTDFAFIAGYSIGLAALAGATADAVGQRSWPWLADAGAALAWGALVAGALDVVENVCLLRMLREAPDSAAALDAPARVARVAAGVKFLLVGAVVVWLVLWVLPLLMTPHEPSGP